MTCHSFPKAEQANQYDASAQQQHHHHPGPPRPPPPSSSTSSSVPPSTNMADLFFSTGPDTTNAAATAAATATPPTSGPFDFLSMEGGAPQSEAMQFGSPSKQTAKGCFIVAIVYRLCQRLPYTFFSVIRFSFIFVFFYFVLCLVQLFSFIF